MFYLEAVNVLLLVGGKRFVGQCPAFYDACPDRFRIFFEFDEFHRFLFNPFTGAFVDDIDVIADGKYWIACRFVTSYFDHIWR